MALRACNNCRLTVTVQDPRGGQTTGFINLCIAASSTDRYPPAFTNSYQSGTSTSAGQTVTFDVTAMDAQDSTLTFTWNGNTGSLATAQSTSTTSRIVWTAPACAPAGVTPTVTAVVTNAYGLSASKPFSISGLSPCSSSGWSPASTLSRDRTWTAATRLSSGKVLVAGGYGDSFFSSTGLATTELYDPATNAWSSAGSLASPRGEHRAIALTSGKVLVFGGVNTAGAALATTEVYNPATNSWSSAGSMATARRYHTATLLSSGKVLVTGGSNSVQNPIPSTEVYDPATNSWSSAGSMPLGYHWHSATLLLSGQVLIAGGDYAAAALYAP